MVEEARRYHEWHAWERIIHRPTGQTGRWTGMTTGDALFRFTMTFDDPKPGEPRTLEDDGWRFEVIEPELE